MSDSVNSSASTHGVSYHDEQQEYQLRTEAMLNSLGEGLLVTDEHGTITTINSYALSVLGYSEEELIGKWMPRSIVAVDQYGRPLDTLVRPIMKSLTTGHTVSSYSHYLTKNGTVMPVHITVSPIVLNDRPTGAVEVFRDLTKEMQLDVAKDEFVSLASHQLRTPATAVKSILSMLSNGDFGPLTERQQYYMSKAIQSNDRQLQVIEDLLNVALVDSGKMELDLEYIDLAGVVREAANDHMNTIQSRSQRLKVDAPGQLKLLADAKKLRMAIDNLVSNASKYSPGDATITVRLEADDPYAILSIADQGVGIPDSEMPNIFTKFTRLPNELSSKVGGTGLGLFLTKNIIELHRGVLTVDSEEGAGSTFTVRLPIKWSLTA